ncbi:hypothetical protein [Phaeobacter gallaeciensis]|uniref:DUF3618 domain-containing protein n=1 Tax=Phaeobacter gallaeciensis TaxID=60890 RepID=A0AAC9Z6Y2_9RHOB|nr:hypothetical protein [Phaeobacter gallaeciensis]AHD08509.1 hypothetical protein Gal_00726 [Phaeobacter gallaeciensis DSM 26640]ATE91775.1 hypothetical protein PhaeoP11_00722 [Phaeobacter gallaeciensis]ATE98401.1 hypothetical protein PhaeoP73_03122 [Phaeobacter gallaeciensis]ATF00391.1 hypothetical protein PhaeoP75_00723 [Phaeobacter gallaeciensis]ATF04823.1 hypothetical protein PhaeoP63_00723 [Phaeobacter gallaeciensis]
MTDHSTTPHPIERAKQHASELAEQAQDTLRSEARARAEEAQTQAAGEAAAVARAADAAASELPQGSFQAEAAQQLAQGLEQFADKVRTADIDKVLRDTGDFARKNPMLFLGGAALLGFAATRFLKSTAPDSGHATTVADDTADDPWGSYEANHVYPTNDTNSDHGAMARETGHGSASDATRRVS